MFFRRVPGEAFGKIPRIECVVLAAGGVPGKGRIGVKPLSKGMWFVGLKKDGCRIVNGSGLWIENPLNAPPRVLGWRILGRWT